MNDELEACQNPDLDLVDALITVVILLDRDLRLVRVNAAAQSLFATSDTKLKQQLLKQNRLMLVTKRPASRQCQKLTRMRFLKR